MRRKQGNPTANQPRSLVIYNKEGGKRRWAASMTWLFSPLSAQGPPSPLLWLGAWSSSVRKCLMAALFSQALRSSTLLRANKPLTQQALRTLTAAQTMLSTRNYNTDAVVHQGWLLPAHKSLLSDVQEPGEPVNQHNCYTEYWSI